MGLFDLFKKKKSEDTDDKPVKNQPEAKPMPKISLPQDVFDTVERLATNGQYTEAIDMVMQNNYKPVEYKDAEEYVDNWIPHYDIVEGEVRRLLAEGRREEAIKAAYFSSKSLGLLKAKEYVDSLK